MPEKLTVRSYLFMFFVSLIGSAICRVQRARGRFVLHNFDRLAGGLANGNCIVLANHPGRMEDLLIQVNTPGLWRRPAKRFMWAVADSRPFGRFAGFMARHARCIMFTRDDPRSAIKMLRTVQQKTANGMSTLIFVEGGRTFGLSLQTPFIRHNGRVMREPLLPAEQVVRRPETKLFLVWFAVPFAQEEMQFFASLWRWLTTDAVIEIRVSDSYTLHPKASKAEQVNALAHALMET